MDSSNIVLGLKLVIAVRSDVARVNYTHCSRSHFY